MKMKVKVNLAHELAKFTGTEEWFRHSLNRKMTYTEGVQFFAENAGEGAYWLLDIIATEGMEIHAKEQFVGIKLKVESHSAWLELNDGNNNILLSKKINYTDCPDGEWKFYLIDNVMLLTSEY